MACIFFIVVKEALSGRNDLDRRECVDILVPKFLRDSDRDLPAPYVVLNENLLADLKRRKDGTIELLPENPTMAPMIYPAQRVCIQGVVVGQLRSYR